MVRVNQNSRVEVGASGILDSVGTSPGSNFGESREAMAQCALLPKGYLSFTLLFMSALGTVPGWGIVYGGGGKHGDSCLDGG
jgi:hypothetical protein